MKIKIISPQQGNDNKSIFSVFKKNESSQKENKFSSILFFLRNIIAFIVFPALTFYFFEAYTHNIFETMTTHLIWFNLLFYWLAAGFLFFLFGKLRSALIFETILFGAVGLADYYVYRFRSNPILPWDIYSLKTAASVSDNYDYSLTFPTIKIIIIFLIMAIVIFFLCNLKLSLVKGKWKYNLIVRIIGLLICILGIGMYSNALHQDSFISKMAIYDKLFTPDTMQYKDGSAVAFIIELKYVNVQKPSGYTKEDAESILDSYADDSDTDSTSTDDSDSDDEQPNIIVMMNEAFSDPAILCDFDASEDYMPFIHSLEEGADNTITGYLDVSVLGGNTANTEFEFLTGDTMAFLTDGSVAYQQYIHRDIPSIVSQLNSYGYETISEHPYKSTGWNRNKVYPYMGFSKMLFQDDFDNPTYIRTYISDQSCVNKIEEEYEEKDADTPLFLFNVTMQNHGGYTNASANFSPDITVDGVDDYATLSYLSLLKKSDEAFENLVDYFENQDEKTIIVMFGDHQPSNSVVNPLLELSGETCSTLTDEETYDRYKVPLIIWANYDIEEDTDVEMSANYLAGYVLDKAGVKLSAYQTYLAGLQEEFPVISGIRVMDADGNSYDADTAVEKFSDDLMDYKKIQYYSLFDWEPGEQQ